MGSSFDKTISALTVPKSMFRDFDAFLIRMDIFFRIFPSYFEGITPPSSMI